MTEKDLEIQELRKELKKVRHKLEYVRNFIDGNCIYDEHLQGYVFDLPKGKVRTLMYHLKEKE